MHRHVASLTLSGPTLSPSSRPRRAAPAAPAHPAMPATGPHKISIGELDSWIQVVDSDDCSLSLIICSCIGRIINARNSDLRQQEIGPVICSDKRSFTWGESSMRQQQRRHRTVRRVVSFSCEEIAQCGSRRQSSEGRRPDGRGAAELVGCLPSRPAGLLHGGCGGVQRQQTTRVGRRRTSSTLGTGIARAH